MQHFPTTEPDVANPFAETADDPRELSRKISVALGRARRAPSLAPRAYWEGPELHGSGRQVSLRRGRVPAAQLAPSRRAVPSRRLPPLPRAQMTAGQTAAIVGGVIVVGGLLAWLWHRKRGPERVAHVGSGFDYLGCD